MMYKKLLTKTVTASVLMLSPLPIIASQAFADDAGIRDVIFAQNPSTSSPSLRHRSTPEGAGIPQTHVSQMIKSSAGRHGVPEWLALRVAWVESRHRCGVANPRTGASGPLQVLPSTARAMGYSGGAGGLRNCGTGLEYGMRHLAMCYRLAGGNQAAAARCHLSGPGAMHARTGANRGYVAKVYAGG
jgi:soluble lytic murein transglycosylase-like protein